MAKRAAAPLPFPWPEAGALAWAAAIVLVAFASFCKSVPFGPLALVSRAAALAPLGPHFFSFWLGHLARTLAAASFFVGAYAVGDHLLPSVEERLRAPLALGAGLSACAAVAFLLFAAGLGRPVVFTVLFAALGLFGVARFPRRMPVPTAEGPLEKLLFGVIIAAALLGYLGTTQPEVSYDALVYHLALPQEWLRAGSFIDLPWNHFSYLPLFASLIYAYGLAVGGLALAKLLNFGFALSLGWTLKRCGEALAGRSAGLAATAVFVGTPLVLYLCWATNSDLPAAFFVLLAGGAAWTGAPVLAGLFAGVAVSCKYTALFAVAPILLKARARALPLFLLALLPWWARDYKLTGNPVYPFLVEKLGPKSADPSLLADWRSETRDASPGVQPAAHARKLWDDATQGFDSVAYNFMGPLALGLLPLALGRYRWPGVALLAAVLTGLGFTYITRLLLSAWVPLSLLAACAAVALENKRLRLAALALILFAAAFETLHFSYMVLLSGTRGLAVASGGVTADEYLSAPHNLYPNPSYPAYRFIAGLGLKPTDHILSVGESRSLYAPNPIIAGVQHDAPPLYVWARESKDADALLAKLDSMNVKVVLSNRFESERIDPPQYATPQAISRINAVLMKNYERVFSDGWTIVLRRR